MEINEIKSRKTTEKINLTKSWFFEKINKINKALVKFFMKREKTQIAKITNQRRVIISNILQVERIIGEY